MNYCSPSRLLAVLSLALTFARADFPPHCDCHSFPSHHAHTNPFCGSDGLMYANRCLAACQGILHSENTPCAMPIHLLNPIVVEQGGVSADQITRRFTHEGFRFLGVANLTRQAEVMALVVESSGDETAEPSVTAQSPHDHPNVDFLFTRGGHVYGRSSTISDADSAGGRRRLFGDTYSGKRGVRDNEGWRKRGGEESETIQKAINEGDGKRGSDNREPVEDTTIDPWRKIGWLEPTGCTGSVVGPRHILTNAHCVFSQKYGEFFPLTFEFSPGLQGDLRPFGKFTSDFVLINSCFTNDKSPECDYAVVVMEEPIGEVVGSFKLDIGCKRDEMIDVTIAGYPIDMVSENGQRMMWMEHCSAGKLGCGLTPRLVPHHCKVLEGNSGSPLFDRQGRIQAIHSGLQNVEGGGSQPQAVAMNPFVFKSVKKWIWKT